MPSKDEDVQFLRSVVAKVEKQAGVRPNRVLCAKLRRPVMLETFLDSMQAGGKGVYYRSLNIEADGTTWVQWAPDKGIDR